jgi:uncharacterized protein (DUF58 family)
MIWRKLRDLFEDGIRQRITRTGIVYSGSILLVGLAAFASANNLLFLILAAMLSTLLVSGFISRLSLAGLEMELHPPAHVSARRKTSALIRLRNEKSWMPSFSLHVRMANEKGEPRIYFPVVPGGAALEQIVQLEFPRRGLARDNTFLFSTRFPFGFTERYAEVQLSSEILVYPCLDPQHGFEALRDEVAGEIQGFARGRGSDFHHLRPYELFESARHVDWKTSARTGELQVREFAREEDERVLLLLDLAVAPADDAWFERAVDCCAYLVWEFSRRGTRLRLMTQTFSASFPDDGDVYTMLRYLALVTPETVRRPISLHGTPGYPILFSTRGRAALAEERPDLRLVDRDALPAGAAGASAA